MHAGAHQRGEAVVERGWSAALVAEDDANFELRPRWAQTLEEVIAWMPEGWTTCQLYFAGEPNRASRDPRRSRT